MVIAQLNLKSFLPNLPNFKTAEFIAVSVWYFSTIVLGKKSTRKILIKKKKSQDHNPKKN